MYSPFLLPESNLDLKSVEETLQYVTIQMKATEQYFVFGKMEQDMFKYYILILLGVKRVNEFAVTT